MLVSKKQPLKKENFFQIKKIEIESFWNKTFFFKSGGDALIAALDNLEILPRSKIIIPSFICKSIPQKLRDHSYEPVFVDVTLELQIARTSILQLVERENISAIMLVDYFGFLYEENLSTAKSLKHLNIPIIIDRCHSSSLSQKDTKLKYVDAIIFSFRKTFAVENGGALLLRDSINTKIILRDHFYKDIIFSILSIFELAITKFGWPNIYSPVFTKLKKFKLGNRKKTIDIDKNRETLMLSHSLYNQLSNTKELNNIFSRRINNFLSLKSIFQKMNISFVFHQISSKSAPQTMPIIDNSGHLTSFLNDKGIGAYNWPGDDLDHYVTQNGSLFPNTVRLNRTIVCIPLHQGIQQKHLKIIERNITKFRGVHDK